MLFVWAFIGIAMLMVYAMDNTIPYVRLRYENSDLWYRLQLVLFINSSLLAVVFSAKNAGLPVAEWGHWFFWPTTWLILCTKAFSVQEKE